MIVIAIQLTTMKNAQLEEQSLKTTKKKVSKISEARKKANIARTKEKARLAAANNIGKRLAWIRFHLEKISQTQVASESGIPCSSYKDLENNLRTTNYEDFLILSDYYSQKWLEKFVKFQAFPAYKEVEIRKITPMFLIFGIYQE